MKRVAVPLQGPNANGRVAWVSPEDEALVLRYKWYPHTYRGGPLTYARTRVGGKPLHMHRLLLSSPSLVVDHIDGDGLNNTRENIELVSAGENMRRANAMPREHKEQRRRQKLLGLLVAIERDREKTAFELSYMMRKSRRPNRGLKYAVRTVDGEVAYWTVGANTQLWAGPIGAEESALRIIANRWIDWMIVNQSAKWPESPRGARETMRPREPCVFHGRHWVGL